MLLKVTRQVTLTYNIKNTYKLLIILSQSQNSFKDIVCFDPNNISIMLVTTNYKFNFLKCNLCLLTLIAENVYVRNR